MNKPIFFEVIENIRICYHLTITNSKGETIVYENYDNEDFAFTNMRLTMLDLCNKYNENFKAEIRTYLDVFEGRVVIKHIKYEIFS